MNTNYYLIAFSGKIPSLPQVSKAAATVSVGVMATYGVYKIYRGWKKYDRGQQGRDLLLPDDSMATDHIHCDVVGDAEDGVGEKRTVEEVHSGDVVYDVKTIRVVEHRRVHNKGGYVRCMVADAKNRFGCPNDNKANRLAVRKYILDAMQRHGVRPTHIANVLPIAIELVFHKSEMELRAEEMARCMHPDWWDWLLRPFRRRRREYLRQ